jgi:hypothetical protein
MSDSWERLPLHMLGETKMMKVIDGTKIPHHGLFYMENAGGLLEPEPPAPITADERQPSCFALEDEKGEDWKGSGATRSQIFEARPSL